MTDPKTTEGEALEGGSYEVIRSRLLESARTLTTKADALNTRRKATFGGTELTVVGNERVRTENNCVPRDIINVGGTLLLGYNVFLGLKTETKVADVFSLHKFEKTGEGFDLAQIPEASIPGLLAEETFAKEFGELYKYYKDARLLMVRQLGAKLLAVFQIGAGLDNIKVLRWALDPDGRPTYIDNRGDQDHVWPPAFDFEWRLTTREDHVSGRHPHVSILDQVFVETVGGDLTIKVENNTEDGRGIYREPVEDPRQSLDDAEIRFAKVGQLILLDVLPYQETVRRYLVYNTRTQDVRRIDAIGQACIQLPEDHGIVFPGGYYLQTGDAKTFDADARDLRYLRSIKSPNGEDVLYVFYHQADGRYLLLPYNLIRKEVPNPILCHGFTLFDDGKMIVFRSASDEPTRVHPMQIWQTPFMSDEFAAAAPKDGSYLTNVGNADLVRGVSDTYSVVRLIQNEQPTRHTYEDLIAHVARMKDAYYWLGHAETFELGAVLDQVKTNAELIIDEFEKVQALRRRAGEELAATIEKQKDILRELRPEDWRRVSDFLHAMTALRRQRGHIITVREIRYMDLDALEKLEEEAIAAFDRVSKYCVEFLLTGQALAPLVAQIDELEKKVEATQKAKDVVPFSDELEALTEGLNLLSETVSGLEVDDPTKRTQILESISEVFGHLNRVRATMVAHRKTLLSKEGKAEFAAQFKLLGQSVSSSVAMADTPEKCDLELSRLMVQVQELEGRFSEFDEFLGELTTKRDEIYEAFGGKRQQLLDERQRRAQNISAAADRILEGVARRAKAFAEDDALNAYFASDPMILKLGDLVEQLRGLGDSVKADDVESKLKASKRDASRNLRDKKDLYEDGESVIKLGAHRFNVNTQRFELTMVPRDGAMALHLTGTDFYERIEDERFNQSKPYWDQTLISETQDVYRGEYLAYSILRDAEDQKAGLDLRKLTEEARQERSLVETVRAYAAGRYDEGYERGLHDADTAKILEKLLSVRASAGLLRFAPEPRAWAVLFWAYTSDQDRRGTWHRRAKSLARLRKSFAHVKAEQTLAAELSDAIRAFLDGHRLAYAESAIRMAGRYLLEELVADHVVFTTSLEAARLETALIDHATLEGNRRELEDDLAALEPKLPERLSVALAHLEALLDGTREDRVRTLRPALIEAAVLLLTKKLPRKQSSAITQLEVQGLLGNHPRIVDRTLVLRLDEFMSRLAEMAEVRVPGFEAFRTLRQALLDRERHRLRLSEFEPRVLTSFVRNKLINDVYLPLIGSNLAKQIGSAGEKKRTDLMGMLLLISPPGYGKTTLMEYMASRLGMVFMKINGPSLGHNVISLDPGEAPNATSRQEVEKVNLAFEMANNVMLYIDDIQHTNPEFLQKFISLCDGSRRVEGVYRGRTQTYDLRGKKFAVVMAGNPYTESGEKFQIPDMLANRADTYNLGDILHGKEEVFSLSYIENALTSSSVLGPVAARSLDDVHRFVRVAQGIEVPQTEFAHTYSGVETEEITAVLKRLFTVRDVLLRVNQEYIASASQDDRFRTEPPFKLQGSYRNMNKIAEKVVAVMNERELLALITDHYVGEAQTLTTGAEHNLLKLAEMRGLLGEDEAKRWAQIKRDFRRIRVAGGADDDPVVRMTSTIGSLGEHLDGIQARLAEAVARSAEPKDERNDAWLAEHLAKLDGAIEKLATPSQVRVEVQNEPPKDLQAALARQAETLERALLPLVRSSTQNLEEVRSLARPLLELVEVLKLNALSNGTHNGHRPRASAEPGPPPVQTPKPRAKSKKSSPATE
jgi:hypothetical protein